jgi:hypothetical protein
MPSLTKAFKQMRRRGLIAEREYYCEHCGEQVVLEAARQWREEQREVRGFVRIGECGASRTRDQARVPLVFGSVAGDTLVSDDPGSLAVGEVVAECLKEQGIRYEWGRVPGSPILVMADNSLSGVPVGGHGYNDIPLGENHRAFLSPYIPDGAFDRIEGNPVGLLNLPRMRRLNIDPPHLRGPLGRPRVGDHVELGFRIGDAVAPAARREFGEMMDRLDLESMWVEVTGVAGKGPEGACRGELLNVPLFIDPAKLRIGSPVSFTPENVYPVGNG